MPLIPFPDVPQLPGVPNLATLPGVGGLAISESLNTLSLLGINLGPYSSWYLTDDTGSVLIQPDTVVEFEYRGEMKVANYPVEAGSFASYNKVYIPSDARMTMACNGRGAMTRDVFLTTLEDLRRNLTLISIVTPDIVYPSFNVVHIDYRREARRGVSMIIAQIWLQEIRIANGTPNAAAQPEGVPPTFLGQLNLINPSVLQNSSISLKNII